MTSSTTTKQTSNIPNTFQNPNWIIDELLWLLTGDETKVLTFIVRHILGWERERAVRKKTISRSMFESGYTDEKGYTYHGVGLGYKTIQKCTEALSAFGIINKGEITNDGIVWELPDNPNVDWDALHKRYNDAKEAANKRTRKARKSRGGCRTTGVVVAQQGGVVVAHRESNPPSNQQSNPLSAAARQPTQPPPQESKQSELPEPEEKRGVESSKPASKKQQQPDYLLNPELYAQTPVSDEQFDKLSKQKKVTAMLATICWHVEKTAQSPEAAYNIITAEKAGMEHALLYHVGKLEGVTPAKLAAFIKAYRSNEYGARAKNPALIASRFNEWLQKQKTSTAAADPFKPKFDYEALYAGDTQ